MTKGRILGGPHCGKEISIQDEKAKSLTVHGEVHVLSLFQGPEVDGERPGRVLLAVHPKAQRLLVK